MSDDFCLSEKIEQTHFNEPIDMLKAEEVKEFIKRLKEEVWRIGEIEDVVMIRIIDNIAGEKLI